MENLETFWCMNKLLWFSFLYVFACDASPEGIFLYNVALSLNDGIEFKASIVMFFFYIVTILLAELIKKKTKHTSTEEEREVVSVTNKTT